MTDLVKVDSEQPAATLTLARPEARNALSVELCDAIVEGLTALGATGARSVIIEGEGSVFCSGADFAAVSGEGGIDFVVAFERMLEAVARFRLPTVAKIQGAALGGGLQLATVCDFRIAATDAKVGIPSSKLGILVNFTNIQRLVHLTGVAVAKEVLMTGRVYSGAEAERAGLVNRVVDPAGLDDEVARFAEELASRAPLSVQGTKRAIQHVVDHQSAPSPIEIDDLVNKAYRSEDLQEGLRAMSEKRPPKFTGK